MGADGNLWRRDRLEFIRRSTRFAFLKLAGMSADQRFTFGGVDFSSQHRLAAGFGVVFLRHPPAGQGRNRTAQQIHKIVEPQEHRGPPQHEAGQQINPETPTPVLPVEHQQIQRRREMHAGKDIHGIAAGIHWAEHPVQQQRPVQGGINVIQRHGPPAGITV